MLISDLAVVWESADGRAFHIHGAFTGHRRGEEGVITQRLKGVLEPPSALRRRSAARQDGSSPGTRKVDERIVELTSIIQPTSTKSLDEVSEDWAMSFSDRVPGRLVLTTPRGVRWLNLYRDTESDPELDRDPHRRRHVIEARKLLGADPWAHSEPLIIDVTIPDSGEATVQVENPATAYTYPTFTCTPGQWELPDGIGGLTVPLSEISQPFMVDTDGLHETITIADNPQSWRYLLGRSFTNRLERMSAPADVVVKGPPGGQCRITIDQRWESAW